MELLILTGACGVGKSSTAIAWARRMNGAVIECDYLTEWIYQKEFPHWTDEETTFVARASAALAIEYLRFGLSVAAENVWSPDGIRLFAEHVHRALPDTRIKAAWLRCELQENHRRDRLRPVEDQMRERVAIVNEELDNYQWPDTVIQMDTTEQTIEQVTNDLIHSTQLL